MRRLIPWWPLLLLAIAGSYWSQAPTAIQLPPTTSPSAGQPATQVLTIIATGIPGDSIPVENVTVGFSPSTVSGGPVASGPVRSVIVLPNKSHAVTFQIPTLLTFARPTVYRVSITGRNPSGAQFASANASALTINPPAKILSLNPNQAVIGQTVAVAIVTEFTNFVQGTTRATFGAGVAVGGAPVGTPGLVTVTSPTTATAQLVLDSTAATGVRAVVIATGVQQATLAGGFSVVSNQPIPVLTSATPASSQQGQSLAVTLTGRFTNWTQGASLASFGDGIAVGGSASGQLGPVNITSPTSATAQIVIAQNAPAGPRALAVRTGNEVLSLPNGFVVTASLGNKPPTVDAGPDQTAVLPNLGLPTSYTLSTLPTLGGAGSTAEDINYFGDVAGMAQDTGGNWLPVVWIGGRAFPIGSAQGSAKAVNINGLVGGQSLNSLSEWRNFLFDGTQITDFAATIGGGPGGCCTWKMGFNRLGHLVGLSASRQAFLYRDGLFRDLPPLTPSGYGHATAINDSGVIAGVGYVGSEEFPVRWIGSNIEKLPGFSGAGQGRGYGINSKGEIAGEARLSTGPVRAVVWRAGNLVELGQFGGAYESGIGLNDSGMVLVGSGGASPGGKVIVWQDGAFVDVTPFLGVHSQSFATQINNRGQITGYSFGRTSWVLTPEDGTPTVKITLAGTVIDDGLPSGVPLKATWTKVSGPGAVTFTDSNQATTTASITQPGTYVLRLTGDDSLASSFDEVTVIVTGANKAPTVDAGPDKTTSVSTPISLGAFVADDGLPQGGSLTVAWSKLVGPGTVTFSAPTSPVTNATFSLPGEYLLRIIASDSELSSNDDVTVIAAGGSTGSILSVNPNTGAQGQSAISITVSGQGTSWSANSTLTLGPGVAVTSLTSASPTSITASLTIAQTAATGVRTVTVTTGATAVSLGNAFTVTAPAVPAILSISPSSGGLGQGGPVAITGQNTNFVQGVSQLSVGTGVTVTGVTVTCATCLTAQLAISASATPGFRNVTVTTGAETVTLINGFTIQGGTSLLTSLVPASGRQGQLFGIAVTGQATNFAQGSTQVSIGAGVTVTGVTVSSPTSLTAQVSIAADAAVGSRNLTVTTGAEVVSAASVFTVQTGVPVLLSINPTVGQQGQSVGLTVTGQFTSFASGSTQVSLGPDIAVSSINVISPTTLTAQLAIGAASAIGPRAITVTTGGQSVSLANAFTVQATPVVILTGISPNTAQLGQSLTVTVAGQGTAFAQGQTVASFGAGVTVGGGAAGAAGPVTVNSPTQFAAQLTIAANAAPGLRTLTVQTGAQQLFFADGFAVNGTDNAAPIVNAGPDQTITFPAGATLSGTASDDGKPTGSVLTATWSRTSGPGTVTFANPNSSTTTATFSAAGAYVLRLTATDGQLTTFDEAVITVRAANQAPLISIAPAWSVALPARLLVNYTVTDDGLPSGGTLTVSWDTISGPGTVGYQDQTLNSISAGFSQAGVYTLRITATDTQFTATQNITVTVSGTPAAAPTAIISSPTDGAEVTSRIDVKGTADSPNLASWTLEYRLAEDAAFQAIATGTTKMTNATLGTFDPTILLNGIAYLRLRVTDTNNQTATSETISLVLTKNLKIGNFTVSFNDMTVPMAGLPIQVVRTYDSRSRGRPGDFSYGWTLDLKSVRVNESRTVGLNWQGTVNTAFPRNYCIVEDKSHIVTVTMPDGTTHRFRPVPSPQCQLAAPLAEVNIAFAPLPGTTSSLSIGGASPVAVSGSYPGLLDLLDKGSLLPADPNRYRLTLADGRVLVVNQITGLETMTDLNGNRITFTLAGIQHSGGKSITFTRDAAQRITRITDPVGNFVSYTYNNLTGDLISSSDRENQTTNYTYDTSHALLTIKDPRGIQPIRNEYDASGRLTKHVDPFGKEILYTHSTAANQEIVTDRLGNVTVNEYDFDGNVTKLTDPLGGITSRAYDSRENQLSETNPLGKIRTFTYDAQDNRLTETDPLGCTTAYTYNARRQVLRITDCKNRVTTNTYGANGNLTQTQDPAGNLTKYEYNAAGQQTKLTDAAGAITQYQYGGTGNLIKQTDALGRATDYTYDAVGNKKTETRSRTTSGGMETLVTSYLYDKENRLTKTTYPDGSSTQITYNAIGKQATTIDPLGRVTQYTYDELGRLTKTTFPDTTFETSAYDAEGRRTASADRGNRTTNFEFDALGRLKKTTFPDTATSQTAYDSAGQVTQTTDALGNATTFTYDDTGRRTKVTNALSQVTESVYDQIGNQTMIKDANGFITQFQYDSNNRRTTTIYPDATTDQGGYNAVGRAVSKTDQAGRTTQFKYDALGRLTQVTDALNQSTLYSYDEVGNRITQTDAKAQSTKFENDKLGRRTKRTLPLNQVETMTYDAAGNLKTKTDFNGRTTAYNYDQQNRLSSKTPAAVFGAPAIQFTFTATGQRASMIDATGSTTYFYDQRDRLTQKATPQGTLTYSYDLQGNLKTMRSSNTNGTSVDYTYDKLNRLEIVTDNRLTPGVTTYTYDPVGNLKSYLYPNGVTHTYTYNSLNRLTNLAVAKTAAIASYAYTLGPSGNRTKVAELGGRTVDYTYDALYRLTSETIGGGTVNGAIGYTYDPVGNRLNRTSTVAPVLAQAFTYDANDRLSTDTYDSNGNMTASGADSFTYDFENRLLAKNGTAVVIAYDGDGNRVFKTVGGVTTRYLVDDRNLTGYAQVLDEITSGAVQRVHTYGLNRISQSQASGTSFYGYDGQGSVRILTDATGVVTDRYDYDAFGNLLSQMGTTPNDFRYAAEQVEPSLGLYYLRARFLNAATGRFWTVDTFEGFKKHPRTLYKYAYAGNDPVNLSDPSGQFALPAAVITTVVLGILSALPTQVYAGDKISALNQSAPAIEYQLRTVAGGGLSVFLGGSVTTFEFENIATKESQYYTLSGLDFGVGFKAGGVAGPSSWSRFSSSKGLTDFHGYVILKAASASLVAGYGGFDLYFVTGPAAGLKINDVGWVSGLGAGITATHGWMALRD